MIKLFHIKIEKKNIHIKTFENKKFDLLFRYILGITKI